MADEESEALLRDLLDRIEVEPHDLQLYRQAMTHSSFLNERGLPAWEGNERQEFLGDAVVGLVVTETLYRLYPRKKEGALSKIKSVVVSRAVLAKRAKELGLARPLKLGVGESKSGGKSRHSILAAVFESFVGALYLDRGYDAARRFCLDQLAETIEELGRGEGAQDDKSRLQELVQQKTGSIPRYRVVRSEGPDHNKWFAVEVSLKGRALGSGEGASKKAAEQAAARVVLDSLDRGETDLLECQGDSTE